MIVAAVTDYVSFVDDDDLVAPDYVPEIVRAIDQWPDYVGFQVQCYSDDAPTAVSYHSLEFDRWRNLTDRYERDISHLNPIRANLARMANFAKAGNRAEDRSWADQLRRTRAVNTQVVIPRILYHYLYSTGGSRWQVPKTIRPGERSAIVHPYFSWSPNA
jgi:glycosyltransferase involved in cell wall biosynthesis